MSDIEQRVKKIVAEQLGVAEADIKIESSFVDDLGADSLDTFELLMHSKTNLKWKFRTNKPKKSLPCSRRLITPRHTSKRKTALTDSRRTA